MRYDLKSENSGLRASVASRPSLSVLSGTKTFKKKKNFLKKAEIGNGYKNLLGVVFVVFLFTLSMKWISPFVAAMFDVPMRAPPTEVICTNTTILFFK